MPHSVAVRQPQQTAMPRSVAVRQPPTKAMPHCVAVRQPQQAAMPCAVAVERPQPRGMPRAVAVERPQITGVPRSVAVEQALRESITALSSGRTAMPSPGDLLASPNVNRFLYTHFKLLGACRARQVAGVSTGLVGDPHPVLRGCSTPGAKTVRERGRAHAHVPEPACAHDNTIVGALIIGRARPVLSSIRSNVFSCCAVQESANCVGCVGPPGVSRADAGGCRAPHGYSLQR